MILPTQEQQIVATHAVFIRQVVEFGQNPDNRPELETILKSAAENGWGTLVAAIREILKGQRDMSQLKALDKEDQVIAEAVMRGLQDPNTLPDPRQQNNPQMAAPGLAHMIHAAASNPQALILISNMAEQMSKAGGDMARIAARIRPLINGERNPKKLCKKMSEKGEQLMLNILDELKKLEQS